MISSEDRKRKILCEFKGLWTGKCWIEKCCYKSECDKALTQLNAHDKPRIICPVCNGKKEWYCKTAECMYPCQDCNETGYIDKPKIDEEKLANMILDNDDRDYCRACDPAFCKPPCKAIRNLAHEIAKRKEEWLR